MHAPLPLPPAVRTACPYCGVGCGVLARPDGQGGAITTGDPDHPANFGKLCSKGFALEDTLGLSGRLLDPQLRRADGTYAKVDWDTALTTVADGFRRVVDRDGPGAIAFYLSGQLLTEDYYVANKLAKGFLGSANVDTNSRLCMASTVAGHRRAFGEDVVPGSYEDLDQANLVVLVGSNAAWCHPVLFQRMTRNRQERGAKIVVIDPRRTVTGDEADLFLAIAPGSDTALFAGLLAYLAEVGALDGKYIETNTTGFAAALARAREIAPDIATTAVATGLDEGDVARFFQLFRSKEKVVTCFSQGVNQSAQGTDKVNAVINCHLATGRIGKPGMGPFSLTGQPNAMGGREVGGIANLLAAHMGFAPDEIDRVRRFWSTPRMAEREGLKAVSMFEAIERGEIKALWVMGTNPAVSLPRAGAMREALRKLELFVVSENVLGNDTVSAAPHVLLPAAAWGEKDGTVTNSERRISRQRRFLPPPGTVKPDWWIISEVARHLGFGDAFGYRGPADIFREHAALSGFENGGERLFDLGGLADISDDDYDALEPVQWPVRAAGDGPAARLFSNGRFSTPDHKARFIAPEKPVLSEATCNEFPLRLNTGRLRDQWHTMTRTGQSPRLGAHRPEPFVEVHPLDARRFGLANGGFARLKSRHGACVLKVVTSAGQQRGSVFAPIHWSNSNAASARIGDLVSPQTDPFSGQPEAKATPISIERTDFAYRGFALAREPFAFPDGAWWSQVALPGTVGFLFASNEAPEAWRSLAPILFPDAALTEFVDRKRGLYRAAAFADSRLEGALFLGPAEAPPQWGDLREMIGGPGLAETGPVVCACFGVGVAAIAEAVASRNATSVEEIAKALRAGNKCGTCLPEVRSIVTHALAGRSSKDHAKDLSNDLHAHDHVPAC
ncbi:MAG: molybdopterin-dependent oxidoreductase [Xanthobacteraceae bacterium]|nr:molybdopterin-dependent oxidoreductase [Xanthobacteraceae bacterium]